MVKLIILFRSRNLASDDFIEGYNNFLIAVDKLPGLRKKGVNTVYGATGGVIPYHMVIEAYFDSRTALEKALMSPEGVNAGQLLLKFAGPDTINLFADVLEEEVPPTPEDR